MSFPTATATAVRSAGEQSSPLSLEADVVVVGTGAGGGMCLHDAARAGLKVIALEEGDHRTSADFRGDERHALATLFQDAGARTTDDGAIAVLQGRGVGGSTVHNTNLCKRTPEPILDEWAHRFGLAGWAPARIGTDFAAVEELLHVTPIEPGRVNRNNDVLLRGLSALGWRGGLLAHNRRGCMGSGLCELGCPYDAKENVLKALLPPALAAGAQVWEPGARRAHPRRERARGGRGRARHRRCADRAGRARGDGAGARGGAGG